MHPYMRSIQTKKRVRSMCCLHIKTVPISTQFDSTFECLPPFLPPQESSLYTHTHTHIPYARVSKQLHEENGYDTAAASHNIIIIETECDEKQTFFCYQQIVATATCNMCVAGARPNSLIIRISNKKQSTTHVRRNKLNDVVCEVCMRHVAEYHLLQPAVVPLRSADEKTGSGLLP